MHFGSIAAVLSAGLLVAACASLPTSPGGAAPRAASIPSTPLNLGDWRRANVAATAQVFEREVAGRYEAGLQLAAVSGDLRRYDFACAPNRDTAGRGEPPTQICRRTVTVESCTHTWQVHLFGADALARARALYDRRCGGDGLLGGPS